MAPRVICGDVYIDSPGLVRYVIHLHHDWQGCCSPDLAVGFSTALSIISPVNALARESAKKASIVDSFLMLTSPT